jgi:hypothetical protein
MNKYLAGVLVIILIVAGVWLGMELGKKQGKELADTKLKDVVDLAFPKPAEDIRMLNGVVKAVYGASVQFEMDSLEDYLPKTDGTAKTKEMRFAVVTSKTELVRYDMTKIGKDGNPPQTKITIGDLKPGTPITVRATENIRTAEKFETIRIETAVY